MKTTAGELKTVRKKHPIKIVKGLNVHARAFRVVEAQTLRIALEVYFAEILRPAGWHSPVYAGNTLTVLKGTLDSPVKNARAMFTAIEDRS